MPVDVVLDVDLIGLSRLIVCTNFEFCQMRVTRIAGRDVFAFKQFNRIAFVEYASG